MSARSFPVHLLTAASIAGPIWFCTASPQAASALAIHLLAWLRLVPASGRFRNAGDSDRSMSSENRSITPNTFDSEVPPLNTRLPANSDSNRMPSSQHTQKSFSRITGDTFRRIARLFDVQAAFV